MQTADFMMEKEDQLEINYGNIADRIVPFPLGVQGQRGIALIFNT